MRERRSVCRISLEIRHFKPVPAIKNAVFSFYSELRRPVRFADIPFSKEAFFVRRASVSKKVFGGAQFHFIANLNSRRVVRLCLEKIQPRHSGLKGTVKTLSFCLKDARKKTFCSQKVPKGSPAHF
jgi:hypothetical protein